MGSPQEAISQIKTKKYYEKYLAADKPTHIIGICFDPEQRNITDCQSEEIGN
jgi:hypothetical protein